jgi:hypothetical protein
MNHKTLKQKLTFQFTINHFLINAKLRILPDDLNAYKRVKKATRLNPF